MIQVSQLGKRFGGVAALSEVSFDALDGRITGLLGPNGAGKSTTLRILYTILRADSGAAFIDGVSVAADPLGARGRLGVLPHGAGLYTQLSVRENIEYFGALHGLSRKLCRERARDIIALLEIEDIAERRTKGFSQGQRLKTALARALVHRPRNLVLDEPTNGLDVLSVRKLRTILQRLREQGHCVLFSSHVMQEVAQLCDEVVLIAKGRVVGSGTPEALRATSGAEDFETAFVRLTGSEQQT